MAGLFTTYYFPKTSDFYTKLISSLFSDLTVMSNGSLVAVSMSSGNGERDQDTTSDAISRVLPCGTVTLTGYNFREDEQTQTNQRPRRNADCSLVMREPVAMDYEFTIAFTTKSKTERQQIIEQVVPAFTPNVTVKLIDNTLNTSTSLKISINNAPTIDDNHDGDGEEKLLYTCEFVLNLSGFMYRNTSEGAVINEVIVERLNEDGEIAERWVDVTGDE